MAGAAGFRGDRVFAGVFLWFGLLVGRVFAGGAAFFGVSGRFFSTNFGGGIESSCFARLPVFLAAGFLRVASAGLLDLRATWDLYAANRFSALSNVSGSPSSSRLTGPSRSLATVARKRASHSLAALTSASVTSGTS